MDSQYQSFNNIDPDNPLGTSGTTQKSNNPSSPTPSPSSNDSKKRFNYLVSLQKKHVVIGSSIMVLMFLIFFLMGFLFGYQSNNQDSHYANNDVNKDHELNLENTLTANNAPINRESKLNFNQGVASDELLKQDNPSASRPTQRKSVKVKPIKLVAGKMYYYIQVIATSFPSRAKNIYNEFKKRKYPVKVKKTEKEGKTVFQIRLGLYESKTRALRHLKQTQKAAGFKDAVLVPYRF